MTNKILASQAGTSDPELVKKLVDDYLVELQPWADHHRLLELEKSEVLPAEPQRADFETDEDFTAAYLGHQDLLAGRRVPYKPPEAPQYLVDAVRQEGDTWVADYEFEDDLKPSLRQKKDNLLSQVHNEEQHLLNELVPPGKVRFLRIRANEVEAEDMRLIQELQLEGQKQSEKLAADPEDQRAKKVLQDVSARLRVPEPYLVTLRTSKDNQFISDYRTVKERIAAIQRAAAEMQHDIEDLTEENIDSWVIGKF